MRRFRSSGFPARVLSFVYGPSGDRRTVAGALQDDGLTRSREAAKGDAVGLLWCVLNSLLSSQVSRICFLWHACHRPLTPGLLCPVARARGGSDQWSMISGLTAASGYRSWKTCGDVQRERSAVVWCCTAGAVISRGGENQGLPSNSSQPKRAGVWKLPARMGEKASAA